uniref:Uncharacterized protein n=1 Tax=Octopus bimaculoides TaxID=37653 RepID=A0A0L8HKL5_OCTBM
MNGWVDGWNCWLLNSCISYKLLHSLYAEFMLMGISFGKSPAFTCCLCLVYWTVVFLYSFTYLFLFFIVVSLLFFSPKNICMHTNVISRLVFLCCDRHQIVKKIVTYILSNGNVSMFL